jgi:protein O-GlcNAc transferase
MEIERALQLAWQRRQEGNLQQAGMLCQQVLTEHPDHPDAMYLMGMLVCEAGRPSEAIELMRRALAKATRSNADLAQGHNNLARILFTQGRFHEAADSARQAIALAPGMADAYNSLGNTLRVLGPADQAAGAYRQAIAIQPNFPEAHNNIGLVHLGNNQIDDAIAAFGQAIAFNPGYFEAKSNLAVALHLGGRLGEAIAIYRQILAGNPNLPRIHSSLLYTMLFHPGYDAAAVWQEHCRWNERHAKPLEKFWKPHANDRSPDRRLRIGYVSSDFRDHAIGLNLIPLFREHDHKNFEIVCYSGVVNPDPITRQFEQFADHWRSVGGLSDEQLAELVRLDGIDVLVELALHAGGNRLTAIARKPAPVQVAFAGYPGTTGLTAIDYRLTDPYLDPPGEDSGFSSEKPLHLPHSFWCYDSCSDQPAVNPLPALSNGYITFGCLNNFCKVNDPLLRIWARILNSVERSRLLLLSPQGSHRRHVLDLLQAEGVNPDRIEFSASHPRLQYLELYHRIDIVLDTYPYNGHTTSLDALWMGVPVITWVGPTPVSRAGWCQLSNLELTKLAANTPAEYVAIACNASHNLNDLKELRETLRKTLKASPLCDAPRFARSIEQAYRTAWRQWCQNGI